MGILKNRKFVEGNEDLNNVISISYESGWVNGKEEIINVVKLVVAECEDCQTIELLSLLIEKVEADLDNEKKLLKLDMVETLLKKRSEV